MKKIVDFIKAKSGSWIFVILCAFLGGMISLCLILPIMTAILKAIDVGEAQSSSIKGTIGSILFIAISVTIIVALRMVDQRNRGEYLVKNERGETRIRNIFLGHLIATAVTERTATKTTTQKTYTSFPIEVYRKNSEKTEVECICTVCGEKLKVRVSGNIQCRIRRLLITLAASLLMTWIPFIAVIIFIIGLAGIFLPISGVEGVRLYQIVQSSNKHAILEKKKK